MMRGTSIAIGLGVALYSAPAAAASDCPPVGHLPILRAAREPTVKANDTRTFKLTTRAGTQTVSVRGATCSQSYTLVSGAAHGSDSEIQTAYRVRLQFQGAQLLYADDHESVEVFMNGARQTFVGIRSMGGKVDITVVERPS